jgi:hypothetical protein
LKSGHSLQLRFARTTALFVSLQLFKTISLREAASKTRMAISGEKSEKSTKMEALEYIVLAYLG